MNLAPKSSTYSSNYLSDAIKIIKLLDTSKIEKIAQLLIETRVKSGRLFVLGVGGGAGHASHAVCDFRKIAGLEAYTPVDNVSEITARTNDEGWDTVFSEWLKGSQLRAEDMLLVFSVGGGNLEKNISSNLVLALEYAHKIGAKIAGIVGRDGGYTAQIADACVIVPTVNPHTITVHTESFQALIWHLLVSHPEVQVGEMKWESTK